MGTAGSERRKRWRHKACRRLQARAALRNVAETLKQARRDPSDESLERLRGALLMIERAAAASPKLDAAAQNCARAYALALFQRGRAQEGTVILRHRFPDARYRLADDVLMYGTAKPGATKFEKGSVGAFDDALPEALFRAVARALAPDGAFWPAHSYDDETSGFFSYVHSLDEDGVVVEAARRFRELFARAVPAIAEATGIEWWTHRRPHGAGHQLHFDSADEGAGADGPEHPLCSVVLYLSEARLGGPTLVTTQCSGDVEMRCRDAGALVPVAPNRAVCFRGDMLHCVVPGRGPAPGGETARRVTLMISFWRRPHARHDREGAPRAAMRFPTNPWTAPFWTRVDCADDAKPTRSAPVPVAQLWTVVVDGTADDGEPVYPREPVPLPPYEACWQGF